MHIAYLLPEFPHQKVTSHCAGIGTASKNIILGLLPKHRISVFVYSQDCTEIIIEGNLTIYKIEKSKYKRFGFYRYRKQINSFINSIIKKEEIDILEAPDWTGITAFMKFSIPNVLRLHGSDAYFCYLSGVKQKLKNFFFEKLAYKNATAVVSVTKYTLEITESIFKIKKRATIIPNGIFLENFETETDEFNENEVLYFGSLVEKKGLLELAQIFNHLIVLNTNAKLVLVGNDVINRQTGVSMLQSIKNRLSEKAKENFEYKEAVPYSEMKKIIQQATVCVFPSLAESFGMVTIEAMAMKKAVVNTNYAWAKEIIINEEMGFLEDPKNHKVYAEKINILLTNKELRNKVGFKAYEHILSNFSAIQLADKNIEFYKSVLDL